MTTALVMLVLFTYNRECRGSGSFNVSRDPGDGWGRSDSDEIRAGTKATKTIMVKDALFPYQKERLFKSQNPIRKEGGLKCYQS